MHVQQQTYRLGLKPSVINEVVMVISKRSAASYLLIKFLSLLKTLQCLCVFYSSVPFLCDSV